MGLKGSPNPTPEMLKRREVERQRYRKYQDNLKRIREARGITVLPSNQQVFDNTDRMELIDAPIKPTSIGWEHISSGRSNS